MGVAEGGPPRHLATIDEADINAAETAIKIGGEALKPGLKAMAGEAWRVAKLAAKMTKTQAQMQKEVEDTAKLEVDKLIVLKRRLTRSKRKRKQR